jgi:hypothetical protein
VTISDGNDVAEGLADEDNEPQRIGRRTLLAAAAAAGVGTAAGVALGADPASAANGGSVLLGETNSATAKTEVKNTTGDGLAGWTKQSGANGVEGIDVSSGGGYGVSGTSTSGTGVYGVSTNSTGVYGVHSTGEGNGISGIDNSGVADSNGIYGSSGHGAGVYGTSPYGSGVLGISTSGDGVYGETYGDTTFGVAGIATAGSTGVYGFGDGTNAIGVYGEATGSGAIALFVAGDAKVTGTLSKGGGSFRIDHPLDPENKYLYHSFVESPDMMNVYNGNVTLDGDGEATVELPDWFEALNRDFRYQLTSIGSFAPVYISKEIEDGEFEIAGGRPEQKISWQVTGIRQDAWANANRIPLEAEKKHEDRGRYLHPELFGGEPIGEIARGGRRHLQRSETSRRPTNRREASST